MKVIFMGTPDFAVYTCEAIKKAGHEIILVVTQPDKPRGRSGALAPSDVKKWALENDIEVFQPVKIRDEESVEYLRKYEADVAVVAAFGQILPESILNMPRFGCINVHASLLPKYRGAAPIQWSILDGEDKTGVTIMQMGVGLDDGDILLTKERVLDGTETGGSLFSDLAVIGGEACVEAMSLIEEGNVNPIKQDEEKATHVGMIKKSLGAIDFNDSADKIERYIRGLNPWPSAFTKLGNKNLKIWKASVREDEKAYAKYEIGEVCFVDKTSLLVKTGDGILSLEELQLEGKKRMSIDAFLLGRNVELGTKLG